MLPVASASKRRRSVQKMAHFTHAFRATLGDEAADGNQLVYLATISRVLPGNMSEYRNIRELKRDDVCAMVRDAFDNPITSPSGGRPRAAGQHRPIVKLVVVAQESHEDGSPHFHAVVRLNERMRWAPAKRTLIERHRVPSHWSCTHSQLWSALRYITVATPEKPIVDQDVFVWSQEGQAVDLV